MSAVVSTVLLFPTSHSRPSLPQCHEASFPGKSRLFPISTGLFFCVQIYLFGVVHKVIYFQHLFSLDLWDMWSYLSLAQMIHFNRCFLD